MAPLEIKELQPDDYDAMIDLWVRAKLPHRPKGRDSREKIAEQIERDGDLYIGAFDGENLVGVVIGNYDGRKGSINRIAVAPERHREGIALVLIEACEKALKKRGVEVISTLIEVPNDPSVAMFKKAGYVHHDDIIYMSKRDRPDA
jgi:ribosomal protein S18 acetylase RimI-like enzyme